MGVSVRLVRAAAMALALTLAAGGASAQGITLAEEVFNEWYDEETSRVRGDIVMGVMLVDDQAARRSPTVAVPHLPGEAGTERSVCVRITSKDGRFEAENSYLIGTDHDRANGDFPYVGKHADDVLGMSAVALVKPGRCGEGAAVALPATWEGGESGDLRIFLNAAGNPAEVALPDGETFYECEDVSDLGTLKYTAVCTVPRAALEEAGDGADLHLTFYVTRSLGEDTFGLTVQMADDGS